MKERNKEMKEKRIEKREMLKTIRLSDLEGSIDGAIEELKKIKKEYKKYHRLKTLSETEYGYYDDRYEYLQIIGWRWETDDEMNKRIEKSKK